MIDLRGLPYMPLYIERLQKSKAWLLCKREPEIAFYLMNLWMRAWQEVPAGTIENDDDVLADAAMCGPKKWLKIKDMALHGWTPDGNGRLVCEGMKEAVQIAWDARVKMLARINRRLQIENGEWQMFRALVFARDDYTCQYCGERGGKLECDHVFPLSRGGVTEETNLATACFSCNRSKGAKTMQEWRQ